MASSPGARRSSTIIAAWTLANCTLHFSFEAAHLSPSVCVRALGGISSDVRPQYPLMIVFWACGMSPEIWALSQLVGHHARDRRSLMLAVAAMFSTGCVVMFTEVLVLWICMLAFCCAAHAAVTIQMLRVFSSARRLSTERFTKRLIDFATPAFFIYWHLYPICWLVSQLSLISFETEHILWPLLAFLTKFLVATVLVFSSFRKQEEIFEDELAVHDMLRKQAEDRNEAKRLFMRCGTLWVDCMFSVIRCRLPLCSIMLYRYLFHEIRVPLQGGQLAVQELQEALDSGELVVSPIRSRRLRTFDLPIASYCETAKTALDAIGVVGKLLDDFLSIAKIEEGRMVSERITGICYFQEVWTRQSFQRCWGLVDLCVSQTIELTSLNISLWLRDVTSVFKNSLSAKRIQLTLNISELVPAIIRTDGNRLRQVTAPSFVAEVCAVMSHVCCRPIFHL
jgi:signal transduction histidine kinase